MRAGPIALKLANSTYQMENCCFLFIVASFEASPVRFVRPSVW